MMKPHHLLCVILLTTVVQYIQGAAFTRASAANVLTIGAFNIQNLSPKKIENAQVLSIIINILDRYDIILVQELVDRDEGIVDFILEKLNRAHGKDVFDVQASPRIGRSLQKEQYGFFYRKDKVKVLKAYVYHDKLDNYEREPYIVSFQARTRAQGIKTFSMVGIHIKPSAAVEELKTLHNVVESTVKNDTEDVILLGDFNADCSYVRKKYWPTIPLWTDEKYLWLIPHDADTTATPSDCAYDRIILRGDKIQRAVVPKSVEIFKFEEEYKLPTEVALAVSDHYPVQFQLDLSKSRQ